MMLELRQSKKTMWGSHVVGKGEIPWKKILESPNMMFKEWVKMDLVSRSDHEEDMLKAPKVHVQVQVEIKIKMTSMKEEENRLNECGCNYGHDQHAWLSVEDYDTFALGTTLEAF
ncbi:hypothetical protein Lal_00003423 [Lupinus albus]|nr:hypothetical protein Lal_00003423 [Lupinus albus]